MPIWEDLLKIEERLENEGDTKKVRRAFWRIVGRIKRLSPPEVSEEEIKKAAEIRNRLFKQSVILSVRTGLILFFLMFLLFFAAYIWVLLYLPLDILWLNVILLLLGILILYGTYPLGRYLGGVVAGVKFEGFYRYSPAEFGLKIEYISYLKARPRRRTRAAFVGRTRSRGSSWQPPRPRRRRARASPAAHPTRSVDGSPSPQWPAD